MLTERQSDCIKHFFDEEKLGARQRQIILLTLTGEGELHDLDEKKADAVIHYFLFAGPGKPKLWADQLLERMYS